MQRKTAFIEGEHYHVYSRGVEKRKIFLVKKDYDRFTALLYIMNQNTSFKMENFLQNKHNNLYNIFEEKREKNLVSILGYCLMPNHIHLILYEHTDGGVSKFMSKLLTAYSMYFNKKYERSGPLFTHPFRSEHISNESQYLYIFSYVHLNPLSTFENNWKENGVKDKKNAEKFLENYKYSSYPDFIDKGRSVSAILDFHNIPKHIKELELDLKTCEENYFNEELINQARTTLA